GSQQPTGTRDSDALLPLQQVRRREGTHVSSFHEAGEPYQRGALHLPAVARRITCGFERNQVKNGLAHFDSRYFRSKQRTQNRGARRLATSPHLAGRFRFLFLAQTGRRLRAFGVAYRVQNQFDTRRGMPSATRRTISPFRLVSNRIPSAFAT